MERLAFGCLVFILLVGCSGMYGAGVPEVSHEKFLGMLANCTPAKTTLNISMPGLEKTVLETVKEGSTCYVKGEAEGSFTGTGTIIDEYFREYLGRPTLECDPRGCEGRLAELLNSLEVVDCGRDLSCFEERIQDGLPALAIIDDVINLSFYAVPGDSWFGIEYAGHKEPGEYLEDVIKRYEAEKVDTETAPFTQMGEGDIGVWNDTEGGGWISFYDQYGRVIVRDYCDAGDPSRFEENDTVPTCRLTTEYDPTPGGGYYRHRTDIRYVSTGQMTGYNETEGSETLDYLDEPGQARFNVSGPAPPTSPSLERNGVHEDDNETNNSSSAGKAGDSTLHQFSTGQITHFIEYNSLGQIVSETIYDHETGTYTNTSKMRDMLRERQEFSQVLTDSLLTLGNGTKLSKKRTSVRKLFIKLEGVDEEAIPEGYRPLAVMVINQTMLCEMDISKGFEPDLVAINFLGMCTGPLADSLGLVQSFLE